MSRTEPSAIHRVRERVARSRLWQDRIVRRAGLSTLIRRTNNFMSVTWLGHPIWQNPLDAWLLQQVIVADDVDFVIECGTNRGGSAYYMASIFDLLDRGRVVTIDVRRMTDLTHPRVEFLVGSSVAPEIVEKVRVAREAAGATRTLLLLDSDHSAAHVLRELEIYAPMLDVGDPILVQDGCIDELPMLSRSRPGPLRAIEDFLAADPRFQVDEDRTGTFVMSHSPKGWLRRIA